MPARIALIGPEGPQRLFLADNLTCDGFDITAAMLPRAVAILSEHPIDMAVIDTTEEPVRALQLLVAIRGGRHETISPVMPMAFITDGSDVDVLRWFELGADDVITRPINYPIVRARVAAILRRHDLDLYAQRHVGALSFNTAARSVSVHGERVDLCRKEYDLLTTLAGDPNRVFQKIELMRTIWGSTLLGTSRTLDSHACRLRVKLRQAGVPNHVVNVWGVGYRLR